jgi:hypothetical protein
VTGMTNYFVGTDPNRWRTGVAGFSAVRYREVYAGIDLLFRGKSGRLEYDFVVQPGADPRQIELVFDGAQVSLLADGALELTTAAGVLKHLAPVVYQESGARRRHVAGGFEHIAPNRVRFRLGAYDRRLPLVIDPVLEYATFLGGSGHDYATRVAVDAAGHAFVVGGTESLDFPTTTGVLAPAYGGNVDAFVAKLSPGGDALVYATYLGGLTIDYATGIALDAGGNAYVSGATQSPNFPIVGGVQSTFAGSHDGFVVKLNAAGTALIYSSYLGGTFNDYAYDVAVDAAGNAYVAGSTASPDFPIANAYQATKAPAPDAFVAKLNPTGGSFVYSTYLGGSSFDDAYAIEVDSSGHAYVTGRTSSANFPLAAEMQSTNAGDGDVFLTKLAPNGLTLVYSTYLGGTGNDNAFDLALGASGDLYLGGYTSSSDYPTVNAFQPSLGGFSNGFVTRVASSGASLVYSSYLGGNNNDHVRAIAVDTAGVAYVTGETSSVAYPTLNAMDTTLGGGVDALVAKIDTDGTLLYSSYLGGAGSDVGLGIAASTSDIYVVGQTQSGDFPISMAAVQATKGAGADAFVAKIDTAPTPTVTDLQNAVSGLALDKGLDTALHAKLTAVLNAIAAGDLTTACASLTAFINQVNAQSGKKIAPADAASLVATATAIKASLGCP